MISDWSQTNSEITIFIPVPYRVELKREYYTITELYVMLNIQQLNLVKLIDLAETVDVLQSRVIMEENKITVLLKKAKEGLWKDLTFQGTKAETKQRRQEARDKYEEMIKKDRETAAKTKQEFTKFVLDQSIKIDDDKKNEILSKKKQEKVEAEKDLYDFVESTTATTIPHKQTKDEDDVIEAQTKPIINRLTEEIDENIHNQPKDYPKIQSERNSKQIVSISNKNSIFTDEDIHLKNEIKPSSNQSNVSRATNSSTIRQQANIPVTLTEKKIPTFAARESLSKEPPYPKSKKYVPEKNYLGQEIDDRNPIWIKEKADNFFKNEDYRSAINAYNKALEIDSTFHKCLLNRGTCLICLGEFDLALKDFERLIELISSVDAKEKEDAFYDKILVRAHCKLYAIHALNQNYSKALEVINDKLLIKANSLPFIIPEPIWHKIEQDKALIIKRQQNEEIKMRGDEQLAAKSLIEAKRIYNDILTEDKNNERVLSNLSLIYLSESNYDEAINCCSAIIKIISQYKAKIRARNNDNSLELKTLLRRANCYEKKGEMNLAEKDIEAIERLEIKNKQIAEDIKDIKNKLKAKVIETYKENANRHLANGEFSEALGFYDRTISLIKYSPAFSKIDLVKIFLNRTSCLIKLSQYDQAIEEFVKIITMLSKQKTIASIQSNLPLLEEVKQLEFLALVKRGFVYTTIKDFDNAAKDYENALLLKPGDTKVKENLEKLKLSR